MGACEFATIELAPGAEPVELKNGPVIIRDAPGLLLSGPPMTREVELLLGIDMGTVEEPAPGEVEMMIELVWLAEGAEDGPATGVLLFWPPEPPGMLRKRDRELLPAPT